MAKAKLKKRPYGYVANFVEAHPELSAAQVAKKLNCSLNAAYNAVRKARRIPAAKTQTKETGRVTAPTLTQVRAGAQEAGAFDVSVGLPAIGGFVRLRVYDPSRRTVGTLELDEKGMRFTPANAKKPTGKLRWETVVGLQVAVAMSEATPGETQ